MSNEMMKDRVQQALDTELAGVRTTLRERNRMYENAIGGTKVKRKLTAGLVLALVLVMIMAAAVAAVLLTRQEIVEQVAAPMAMENDKDIGVEGSYTPEQLAQLIQTLNENGFTMEENNALMQARQNGRGYWEEETMMEICRQAFGGNFYTWTLEQQDWYQHLMVDIGWYESYESCLPGEENMAYEEAEAYAFTALKKQYGENLQPETRELYTLSRQFYHDIDNDGKATWNFTLDPKDIDHGMYNVRFEDQHPDETVFCQANIPDWTQPYTGEKLLNSFQSVYSWFYGQWPQAAWQRMHEMMQQAELNPEGYAYADCRGYQMTAYPEPAKEDLSREDAIQKAKEALNKDRAALDSAVLTEYNGDRAWLIGLVIYQPMDGAEDEEAGRYVITVESTSGNIRSVRKSTADDSASIQFVPEAAYEKAHEGMLRASDYIRLAAETVREKYPEIDPLDEKEYEARDWGGMNTHQINFITKNIQHGNASATVSKDGKVSEVTADTVPLTGDTLMQRFRAAYGYFGQWDQSTWVQLRNEMEAFEPEGIEGKLLKLGRYPEESSVSIDHEKAQELAIQASGKRTGEINTCVLIGADPHPVWKLRVIADDPADQVIELDAETGEVVAVDVFKTDYTPSYVLYSLEKNWRKLELETDGPVQMAKKAVTYQYGDLWLDFPELDFENPEEYEILQDGLTVRFIGRWKGMKSYLTELDENGYVVRCEETEAESAAERPERPESGAEYTDDAYGLMLPPYDAPAPREDGKPWLYGMDFAPETYWRKLDEAMERCGVNAFNLETKERAWLAEYGSCEFWPLEMKICAYMLSTTENDLAMQGERFAYPLFPDPANKSEEEIVILATAAMHAEVDPQMGAEWADSLKVSSTLWNDGFLMDKDRYAGVPCWQVEFSLFEEEYQVWNSKYYMIINEDGEILFSELTLNGNG